MCQPVFGCETISPEIFVALIKYSIGEFGFKLGKNPAIMLSDTDYKLISLKGPSSTLYFQCNFTDCGLVFVLP